jgi:hypothetical protein
MSKRQGDISASLMITGLAILGLIILSAPAWADLGLGIVTYLLCVHHSTSS